MYCADNILASQPLIADMLQAFGFTHKCREFVRRGEGIQRISRVDPIKAFLMQIHD